MMFFLFLSPIVTLDFPQTIAPSARFLDESELFFFKEVVAPENYVPVGRNTCCDNNYRINDLMPCKNLTEIKSNAHESYLDKGLTCAKHRHNTDSMCY